MYIKKILKYPYKFIHEFFIYYKPFGFNVAINKVLSMCAEHIPSAYVKEYMYEKKHISILKYLYIKYNKQIDEISQEVSKMSSIKTSNYLIWQCWWQGEENLSGITQMCVNSVKQNSENTPIRFITLENFSNYVKLPSCIIKKYQQGYISLTELSDILRVNLLWKYGGIWIDATILLNDKIMKKIKDYDFFTCPEPSRNKMFVSNYKWNTSFMGGNANLPLFAFVSKMFEVYWKNEKLLIDYYLLDYLIALAYNKIPLIKSEIDSVPFNNIMKHELQPFLNLPYNNDIWKNLTQNTCIFKLSRKTPEPYIKTVGDKLTFYGFLCQKYSMEINS